MKTLLFDADMFLWRHCFAAQKKNKETGEVSADLHSTIQTIKGDIRYICGTLFSSKFVLCFGSDGNFRKTLFPEYKANRKDCEKPILQDEIRDWLFKTFPVVQYDRCEADDVMGIIASKDENTIMVSPDKDMKAVCGWLYNPLTKELTGPDPDKANYEHMYQTLVGDSTDNYKGCVGVGPKKAESHLRDATTPEQRWSTVCRVFEQRGQTEADALLNARVAYILQYGDYNFKTKEIRLWAEKRFI
jgi:DNA polymerase-1